MKPRRIIKSVLHNFLGTYTSRYSDYDGYWLFGLLIRDVGELRIDLLCPSVDTTAPRAVVATIQLAAQKFREQMEKAGLSGLCAREARLDITSSRDLQRGFVNGRMSVGHTVRFVARVISDYGKTYEHEVSVFVAPHNAEVETRSARGT
jgi:hypothetical protein